MNIIILFALDVVSWTVFVYSLQRKMALYSRWSESTHRALRDWSVDAAQDAKDAVDAELKWTLVFVFMVVVCLLLTIATVDAVKAVL